MTSDTQPDRTAQSWLGPANVDDNGFPLQSLPYCVFQAGAEKARIGAGIGDSILDLAACSRSGLLQGLTASVLKACQGDTLNPLLACTQGEQSGLRNRLTALLDSGAEGATQAAVSAALVPMAGAALLKPVSPPNYTDFYASIHHARRVGQLFRPDNPLLPNYKHLPIGYHGRASSIVVSGTPIRRPQGQTRPAQTHPAQTRPAQTRPGQPEADPDFGPSRFLDYELEVALYITGGNRLGDPIPIDQAKEHIFGLSLLNDWSARDIQSWEYQPLGPFLGKSFATSVSPWVVPLAAFEPFRFSAFRPLSEPDPLPYLFGGVDQYTGAIDIALEVLLLTPAMRAAGQPPHRLSQSNLRDLYWTIAQFVTHHTSNGCNLVPGDLLATGTISGADDASAGCLLELTRNGAQAIELPNGESRTALEDGDEVILRGVCRRKGFPTLSLGECRGVVVPAFTRTAG